MLDVEALSLLQKYNGDNIFVGLNIRVLYFLNEHDVYVRRRILLFGFGGKISYGAFRFPVLQKMFVSCVLSFGKIGSLIFLSFAKVLTVGPQCIFGATSVVFSVRWIYHTRENIEKYYFPKLVVHLEEAREVIKFLTAHKA